MTFADESTLIKAMVDALPVGVWLGRATDGVTVYANRACEQVLGLRPIGDVPSDSCVTGIDLRTRDGAPYPAEQTPFARALRERTTVVVDDLAVHHADGPPVHLRAFCKPLLDPTGEVTHVLAAFFDITREVEAERARLEGEARLRHAQRMESVGNLAGGVAHDFNNLLATVKILASLLRASERDPARVKTLQQIDQVTDSAVRLTRALLGFARRGKNLVQRLPINDVVRNLAELSRRTLDRRIEVACEIAAATGEVMGDASQLEQVVMNLVLNARDAMPDGGRLTLRTNDVEVDAARAAAHPPLREGRYVVVEVEDTGTGIDPAIRDRIFEPYFTTKTSGAVKGTGLGLATVYGVVQTHHGAIEVQDNVPRGTIVRVYLPSAPPLEARAAPAKWLRGLHVGRGTVLLVDDERLVREASAQALKALGYEVLEASDGLQAVEIFRARHHEIVAVVLDMVMPRLGGREAYLEMRRCNPDVPVLLVTGFALNEEAQAILDLGVRGFLAKPYDVEALSEAVARLIVER